MQPDRAVAERLAVASDLLRSGQAAQACAHLEALVTDVPDFAAGWYLLGRLALTTGDAQAAIPMLERATSLDTTQLESQLELALAYFHGGRIDESLRLYQTLLRYGPAVTARLPLDFRNAMANLAAAGGVDNEVRPLAPIPDGSAGPTEITTESLAAWQASTDCTRTVAYFENYPGHSLLAKLSRACIYHCVRTLKPQIVAEIGTYKAGTAEVIARALRENGQGVLHTADPFGRERCPAIIARWPAELQSHVQYHALGSMDFYLRLEADGKRIDMAFIDGNHDYEFAYFDLLMAARNLRRGGLVLMDNIEQQGPLFAVLEFLRNNPAWQVLGRNCISPAAFGNPMANGADRSSMADTSLLILKAPDVHCVYLGAFSTGQIVFNLTKPIQDIVLNAAPRTTDRLRGTLYWEVVFREFPEGAFPQENKRCGEIAVSGNESTVRLVLGEALQPLFPAHGQTIEINLQFSTDDQTPFAFRNAEMVLTDGQAWVFYE